MIISGSISMFAGTSFLIKAGHNDAVLSSLARYANLGGVLFLISALRCWRAVKDN